MSSLVETPPEAPRRPYDHTEHGVTRPDPYHWMRDVDSPELVSHLVAERTWYDASTGHLGPLIDSLRAAMATRVPRLTRQSGGSMARFPTTPTSRREGTTRNCCAISTRIRQIDRRNSSGNGDDHHVSPREPQIVLDANALAEGADYFELGLTRLSPDDRLLAYSVDVVGDEVYTLRFRDLGTGEDLPDEVPRQLLRGRVERRRAALLLHRPRRGLPALPGLAPRARHPRRRRTCWCSRSPTRSTRCWCAARRSGGLVVIWAGCRDTTEVWVVDAHDPDLAGAVGGRATAGRRVPRRARPARATAARSCCS